MSNQHFRIGHMQYKATERMAEWNSKKAIMPWNLTSHINNEITNRANFEMAHFSYKNLIDGELRAIKEAERLRKWRATMKARYGK